MLANKPIIFFLLFVCSIALAHCYVAISLPETHPDHPGKCWWSETTTAYRVGEKFRLNGTCAVAVCHSDFSVSIEGCSLMIIDDPSCRKVEPDLSLPFPDCCSVYECVDSAGNISRH